ncbi:hypothetical protein CPB85DRAFT_1299642 [Mucidula mucida]|nr:hypothetical protein CPB85DRAFT_1299642 [Mucidula mucida]
MNGTRRAPQHTKKDSNALRASVFDVFLELGALDQNSKLAEWILSEETEEDSSACTSSDSVSFERTSVGSRYRERFDSFTLPKLEDDVPPRTAGRSMSRIPRFLNRMRSKSRPKKSAPAPDQASKDDADIPNRAMPKKHSILRFKSTTNIGRKAREQEAPPPAPAMVRAQSYGPDEHSKPQRQALFRSQSQPGPSDAVSMDEEEWEELSPVSSVELTVTSEYNTFLRGAPSPEADVTGERSTHLFRSLSGAVHSGKRLTVFPVRRTLSHPEPPSSFPPLSPSLSTPPPN